METILKKVKKEYFVDHKILNSINFGIPPDRNRLFIIGIRKNEHFKNNFLDSEFNFPWPSNNKYTNALKKFEWSDTTSFQKGTKVPKEIPVELCVNDLMLKKRDEKSIPNGDEYFSPHSIKFWKIEEGNTHNRSFKRLHRYRYSPTSCYGNN